MAIETVSFPMENAGLFHNHLSLPEGISHKIASNHPFSMVSTGFPMIFHDYPSYEAHSYGAQ